MKHAANPDLLRAVRTVAGLSVPEAARRADVAVSTWYKWEQGRRPMRASMLRSFAHDAGVEIRMARSLREALGVAETLHPREDAEDGLAIESHAGRLVEAGGTFFFVSHRGA